MAAALTRFDCAHVRITASLGTQYADPDGADGADSTLPLLRGLIRTGRASQVPPARRCSRRSAGRSASIENMQISSMKLA